MSRSAHVDDFAGVGAGGLAGAGVGVGGVVVGGAGVAGAGGVGVGGVGWAYAVVTTSDQAETSAIRRQHEPRMTIGA